MGLVEWDDWSQASELRDHPSDTAKAPQIPPRDTGDESPKSADRHFISADRKMWYLPISQGGICVPNWQGGSDLQAFLIVFWW